MIEYEDVQPAGITILSLRPVDGIELPNEATVFGRLIEVVRYLGTARPLRDKRRFYLIIASHELALWANASTKHLDKDDLGSKSHLNRK
jgi:hypothetical protein